MHGRVVVNHDAALEPLRRGGAEADDVRTVVLHRRDQHGRLVRTEIETVEHRRLAAYCLGRTGAQEAKDILTDNLHAEDADFAKTCLDALATLLPPGTTSTWLNLLDHPDSYFKTRAVRALAALGEPKSLDALRMILIGQSYPDMQSIALQAVKDYPV